MRRSKWIASVIVGTVVAGAPARAEWMEARSKHFIVFANGSPERVKRKAERLEQFDSLFRYFQRIPEPPGEISNKLTVYEVSDVVAVQRLYGANGSNVGGFYDGRVSGSVAFTPAPDSNREDNPNALNAQVVLFHEYAHHLMLGNFAAAYPLWFSEGYPRIIVDGKIRQGCRLDRHSCPTSRL